MSNTDVDQSGAIAGGDMVGRDKIDNHYHGVAPAKLTKLEQLKHLLEREIEGGHTSCHLIEQLTNYKKPVSHDGIVGLEAKLEKAGRSAQLITALEMKERFAKLLEKWSLYASAQEIIVHLLAMAEYRFSHQIAPQVEGLSPVAIDELIEGKIITPVVEDVGVGPLAFDHALAMGMVYWLAEQCRVRWHQ